MWGGYSSKGGYLAGVLIKFCSVQVAGGEIFNHSALLPKSKSNAAILSTSLSSTSLEGNIEIKNKYFHLDLTFEGSKIVGRLLVK